MPAERKLAFIGIGLMGLPLCEHLLGSGDRLTVWNRSSDKCLPLVEKGAVQAESLDDIARQSDVIFLCLTDSLAVRDVYRQISSSLRGNQIIVDFSSIDPLVTRSLHDDALSKGVDWVDCPVSGGVPGAKAGTLAVMAGGSEDALNQVRPLLSLFSSKVTRMGESGAGQYTKICNQMIVSSNALVIAEVVALAERAGVDSSKLAEAFSGGFADSKPLQILAPEMSQRCFEPVKWHVRTLLKDLDMAVTHTKEMGSAAPMTGLAAQLMRQHAANGYTDKDPSTLINLYTGNAANDDS
ncbi:NAD(P)-dependent oxidoreductase [Oceanospirillum sediminis]|uniref:NAD(P)-dependent oxidoreductase n=1 Tax=Oceanospirillum sediminis TaxID=2760088 RepID=A0A839IQ49_9GAMM|nr:NAD(P)-dependent oxidoreductase [Oceanospirillum sediminis]MBB1486830.1 NAD(P)-dependent oxidoreductase [Oceanospirillum sediminis]